MWKTSLRYRGDEQRRVRWSYHPRGQEKWLVEKRLKCRCCKFEKMADRSLLRALGAADDGVNANPNPSMFHAYA